MPPLRAVANLLLAFVAALGRRLLGRPLRPSWPLGYATVVGSLRRNARWTATRPLAEARQFQERLARTQKPLRAVRREGTTLGGVPVVRHGLRVPARVAPGESAAVELGDRPADEDADGKAQELPWLLYLHGGAHVAGSPATHGDLVDRLGIAGAFAAVVPAFRLAPEHAVDDAVEDVLAVHGALLDAGHRVVWAGDSSGGALAVLASIAARDRGIPLPKRVALISPWVDLRCDGAAFARFEGVDWGTRAALLDQARLAAGARPLDDPRLSPLFAELHGLPPSSIHVGGAEIIQDSVLAFADALDAAGGSVSLAVWPDQVHAFHLLAAFHPEAQRAVDALAAFLRA